MPHAPLADLDGRGTPRLGAGRLVEIEHGQALSRAGGTQRPVCTDEEIAVARARGGELDGVVATQPLPLGQVTGSHHERLVDLDDEELVPHRLPDLLGASEGGRGQGALAARALASAARVSA
jgi:hypothetical protein